MRVTILSLSAIPRDPRVSRQISTLREAGHSVSAIGFGEDDMGGVLRTFRQPQPGWYNRLDILLRQAPARISEKLAFPGFWASGLHRQMYRAVLETCPEIIHANDWPALAIASRAAQSIGCEFIYDSHEFAIGENTHRLSWRILFPPFIRAIESGLIHQSRHVITVSDRLAKLISDTYELGTIPVVIRNTPKYRSMPFCPTGPVISVLYQGVYASDRCLEELIASVAHWRPDRRLLMRGIGLPDYVDSLQRLAVALGLCDRVVFLPPVKPDELIDAASEADIGIVIWPTDKPQSNFALPNKFFEYMMSGLALCVGPAAEMSELTTSYKVGLVTAGHSPEMIAATINTFEAAEIDAFKQRSLATARQCCWENEGRRLLGLYAPAHANSTFA
ncbi:MAG: glycosyltransferase family 4 protein [Rhodospirillaceae bacterium]